MEAKRLMVCSTENEKERIHSRKNTAEVKFAIVYLVIYIYIIILRTLLISNIFSSLSD